MACLLLEPSWAAWAFHLSVLLQAGCKTPVGDALLRQELSREENGSSRKVLRMASGGTVCVDVSNIGVGPSIKETCHCFEALKQ